MARRRYFRYYKRTAPKKKWASNIRQGVLGGSNSYRYDLVTNSTGNSTPTPVIIKTGNFKIQGDCTVTVTSTPGGIQGIYLFLLFLPEGVAYSYDILSGHPEWVMAWTSLDFPSASTTGTLSGNKFSLTTRLKRNLNSGDKIILIVQSGDEHLEPYVSFTAQFFTCAN